MQVGQAFRLLLQLVKLLLGNDSHGHSACFLRARRLWFQLVTVLKSAEASLIITLHGLVVGLGLATDIITCLRLDLTDRL